ncbi:MAG: Crp/Fnr family transcriptional regulator [Alphaproteobacteria bacterium]
MNLDVIPVLSKCDRCPVHHRALCAGATPQVLDQLARISNTRHYKAGQVILSEGEPAPFVANVVSGVVRLTKMLIDGREQVVGLLFPSDFVGRAFAEIGSSTAEAATDVELCCFDKARFDAILAANPSLEHHFLVRVLDELDAAREWMLLLGCKTAREKVASFLLLLARRAANIGCGRNLASAGTVFEIPVGRSDVAGYLGMTIETVSRQISDLKARGIIRLLDARHFAVDDLDQLAETAGMDEVDVHLQPALPSASGKRGA